MIEWNEKLAVGIPRVDAQHQELVRTFNELEASMRDGRGAETVLSTLRFLGEYAVSHFATEESLMRRHVYPGLSEHRVEHEAFKADFARILKETEGSRYRVAKTMEVSRKLLEWLLNHIGKMDKKMGAWLAEKGAR